MGSSESPMKLKTIVTRVVLSLALGASSLLLSASEVVTPQRQPQQQQQSSSPSSTAARQQPTGQQSGASQAALAAKRELLAAASLGGKQLPYRVWLPADYATTTRRYPVLYLLHGLTGDENDWWARSRLADYAARFHLIIITPGVGDSWYANSATEEKARYEDAIIKDLIPYVDAEYRTVAQREGRAIAGLSMGGLAAIKFALRYPQMFVFAGSFSGAFDVPLTATLGKKPSARMLNELRAVFGGPNSQTRRENDVFALLKQPLPAGSSFPYLYISTGKSDPLPQVSDSNPRFAEALRTGKLKYEYNERPGTHDWRFWDSEIEIMLGRLCVFMPQMCS